MVTPARPAVVGAGLAAVSVSALAFAQLVAMVTFSTPGSPPAGIGLGVERDVDVYAGQGAWVDVYDFAPDAVDAGGGATVGLDDIDAMVAADVRTLYLQAAFDSGDRPNVVDPELVGAFLTRAHERGLRVVGWFLPRFADVERDLAHVRAIADFEADGHRFDGVAVDIEWTGSVTNHRTRSARVVELSDRLADEMGDDAVAAIVLPPVLIDVVNPRFWPGFPWRQLADSYDVWLPMGYWTDRRADSGYRDGARYTSENIERLRAHLDDEDAPVHAIGGVGGQVTAADLAGFTAQLDATGAIGGSIYDWASLDALARREVVKAFSTCPVGGEPCPVDGQDDGHDVP